MSLFEEFHERRNKGNELVNSQDYLPYKRFYNLDTIAYSEGALSAKSKELTGLACSLVLRCNDCVLYHIDKAVSYGANREELNETMNIALVIGGSIVIPHLRYAVEAMEERLARE